MATAENFGQELLIATQEICATEFGALQSVDAEPCWVRRWPGNPDVFSPVIEIQRVEFEPATFDVSPTVTYAEIGIADDFRVELRRGDETALDGDAFAEYMLEQLTGTFRGHAHQLCIDALRQQQERMRANIPTASGNFTVADRRRWKR